MNKSNCLFVLLFLSVLQTKLLVAFFLITFSRMFLWWKIWNLNTFCWSSWQIYLLVASDRQDCFHFFVKYWGLLYVGFFPFNIACYICRHDLAHSKLCKLGKQSMKMMTLWILFLQWKPSFLSLTQNLRSSASNPGRVAG